MDQPEPETNAETAKDPNAQDAQKKHWVGVIAEVQQPLRLLSGKPLMLIELCRRPGADGIAADQSQQEGGGPFPPDPEEGFKPSRQEGGSQLLDPQSQEQRGHHQEGKERWDHTMGAEGERLFHRLPDKDGMAQQQDQQKEQ